MLDVNIEDIKYNQYFSKRQQSKSRRPVVSHVETDISVALAGPDLLCPFAELCASR